MQPVKTSILKRYFHIGFAADTVHGLVVPVIRDADKKRLDGNFTRTDPVVSTRS